jgi:hypothetical protein
MTNISLIRNRAREEAELGIAYLARAFNFTNNPNLPYIWAPETLKRFEGLAREIVSLIEQGDIKQRSGAIAQDDIEFQKFLSLMIR